MRPESQFQSHTVVTTLRCTGGAAGEGTSDVAVEEGDVMGGAWDGAEVTGAALEVVLAACCRLSAAAVVGTPVLAGAPVPVSVSVVGGTAVVVVEVVVTVTGAAGVAPVSPRLISLGRAVAGSALVVPKK